jgi:hypothetical protein
MTYAEKLTPILVEIETLLLENYENKPNFNKEAFRACLFIFQSAIMDSMYTLQEKENMPLKQREEMTNSCGNDIKDLVKNYCDIDTFKIFI